MADVHSYLPTLIALLQTQPIYEIMRSDERKRGYQILIPGDVSWLPSSDWDKTNVVSIDRSEVRLIAITATRPHTGAFKRLVSAIERDGLHPVVIEPFQEMTAILKKWGWQRKDVGVGFYHEEQWRPRKVIEVQS